MSKKSHLREIWETGNPQVCWQTFRKRVLKFHWDEGEALNLPPNGRMPISAQVAPQACNVSMSTVRRRIKDTEYKAKYKYDDTRLRNAAKDQPYTWPRTGTVYQGWVLYEIVKSSAGECPGARAIVKCGMCGKQRRYLLKYLKSGKAKPCMH